MHTEFFIAGLAACLLIPPALAADMPAAPYAGQQARSIKALSDEDIDALRNGNGMGMAKAAELNLYPGPAHVLTLAKQLKLSGDQIGKTQAIYDRMNADARSLGVALIAHERNLDRLFATHQATPQGIAAETDAVGALQGHLRAVHLTAHVEMLALLTPEQIEIYKQLRGYGGVTQPHRHGG